MSFLLTETLESRVIQVTVSSKLTKEIFEAFLPRMENAIEKHGRIQVLFLLLGFQGWKAGQLWDELHLELKRFDCIERVAIVGETKWENGSSVFVKPFNAATIKYFNLHELEKAREWLQSSPV